MVSGTIPSQEAAVRPAFEGHTHHYFVKELEARGPVVERESVH